MATVLAPGFVLLLPSTRLVADATTLRRASTCVRVHLSSKSNSLQAVSGRLRKHRRGGNKGSSSPSTDPSSTSLPLSGGHIAIQAAPHAPSSSPPAPSAVVAGAADYATETPTFDELDVYRGLVLDTAYRPINVINWKRALCLDILAKADVLEYYDQVVSSPSRAFPIPAVLRVSNFIHAPKEKKVKLSLSRNNIFLRDKFKCQYCGCKERLTIDHVKAVSRGGGWSWDNLVTACAECNLKKGDKTAAEAGMKLAKQPREPKEIDSGDLPPNYKTYRSLSRQTRTPQEWVDWLPIRQQNHPF